MPNWCANSLKLVATTADSEKKLAEIVQELERAKTAGEDASIFALIKPIPQDLMIRAGSFGTGTPEQAELQIAEQRNLDKYGYKNWYDYCIGEWGTKWEAKTSEDEPYEIEGNVVTIYFDTPWSPPMGIYHALEDMGFNVEATYIEQGMGYIGFYRNGLDHCEQMNQFFAQGEDMDEDDFFPVHAIDDFFTSHGIQHSPSNWGG